MQIKKDAGWFLLERTISGMMGKGSVNHNTRAFSAKNVDKERSRDNVEFCHKDIKAVYHELFDEALRSFCFDVVIDTAYNSDDINKLLDALGNYKDYILVSSSAVYPEYATQPFNESTVLGENKYWGKYGTDKIDAEKALLRRSPNAYILRPPYLYGQMNNVYREAFVFDCALQDKCFYLPKDGEMKLQFFHVEDLCRFIDVLLDKRPQQHIYNVGNSEGISIRKWVEMCYQVAGKEVRFKNVYDDIEQRKYFCFYDYEYYLDVSKQHELMADEKSLLEGLREAFVWYKDNSDKVNKKPYFEFIDDTLLSC